MHTAEYYSAMKRNEILSFCNNIWLKWVLFLVKWPDRERAEGRGKYLIACGI